MKKRILILWCFLVAMVFGLKETANGMVPSELSTGILIDTNEFERTYIIHAPINDLVDLLLFNDIMRKELDNTLALINLLESEGMSSLSHADHPYLEDAFLLGPDLVRQLKKKRKIMLDHWFEHFAYRTKWVWPILFMLPALLWIPWRKSGMNL